MELCVPYYVNTNPIDNIDLSLEHQSFLSTYRLQEEILGQLKLVLLPVILLANSSLDDGATGVKKDLLFMAAEAGQEVDANSIEIA